jgi:hypothetical protein
VRVANVGGEEFKEAVGGALAFVHNQGRESRWANRAGLSREWSRASAS